MRLWAITLDMTVTLGNVLTTVLILGGLLAVYLKMRDRLVELGVKVDTLWNQYERRKGPR